MNKTIVEQGKKIKDEWQFLPEKSTAFVKEKQVMKLSDFLSYRALVPDFEFGLMIESIQDFDQARDFFNSSTLNLALIVCYFDTFKNGVFYSIGQILREQMNYSKRLRASGDVYVDQLNYLLRSGFDSFDFNEFEDKEKLEKALQQIQSYPKQAHYFASYFKRV